MKTWLNYFKIKIHQFEKITDTYSTHSSADYTKFHFLSFRFLSWEVISVRSSSLRRWNSDQPGKMSGLKRFTYRYMSDVSRTGICPILSVGHAIICLYIPIYSRYNHQKGSYYLQARYKPRKYHFLVFSIYEDALFLENQKLIEIG